MWSTFFFCDTKFAQTKLIDDTGMKHSDILLFANISITLQANPLTIVTSIRKVKFMKCMFLICLSQLFVLYKLRRPKTKSLYENEPMFTGFV